MSRVQFLDVTARDFLESIQEEAGMSIRELADICMVHRRSLLDWKNGKYLMPHSVFARLSEFCKEALPEVELLPEYWHAGEAAKKGGLVRYKKYGAFPGWTKEASRRGGQRAVETHRRQGSKLFVPKDVLLPRHSRQLAEFIGILLGDGGITSKQIFVTLHKIDDKEFVRYVCILIKKLFGIRPACYDRKGENVLIVAIASVRVVRFLIDMGLPIGDKVEHQARVPTWILKSASFTKACLRGLYDTDGCFYIDNHMYQEKIYRNPGMNFTNHSVPLLRFFKNQVKKMGLHPTQATRFSLFLRREREIQKYFHQIGSRNPKHTSKFEEYFKGKYGGVPKWS